MTDPWLFGWTQVLTLLGFAITVVIAIGGFRTFNRWKREKIEEARIAVAIDALAIAYESKYVFENIRSALSFSNEYDDMPATAETEAQRRARGAYYAVLRRIRLNMSFFESVWKLQPRCMAVFGAEVGDTFQLLHKARRHVEVACGMLMDRVHDDPNPTGDNKALYAQLRRDAADHGDFEPEKDRVAKMLKDFASGIEKLCRPIIDRNLK